MKKINLLLLLLICCLSIGWTADGGWKTDAAGTAINWYTVATLPATPSANDLAGVTDGADSSDCTVGRGTDQNLCVYTGSAWSIIGDGGGVAAGDVTAVGNCANGECFTGTTGDTLTFNNASGDGVLSYNGLFNFDKGISSDSITLNSIDTAGAADIDYGSDDVTDHTFVSDGGTIVIDGPVISGANQHLRFNLPNPNDYYTNVDHEVALIPQTDAALTITNIECTLDAATNELAFDLKFADTFIGLANATVIDVCDTSSGVTSISAGFDDATVPASKAVYILLDATPHADITQLNCDITYDYD